MEADESNSPPMPNVPGGIVNIPAGSEQVLDADDEIFFLYTRLASKSNEDENQILGLGSINSKTSEITITLEVEPSTTSPLPAVRGSTKRESGRSRSKTTKKNSKLQSSVVEVVLEQDPSGLRSRQGDTGSVLWRARYGMRIAGDSAEEVIMLTLHYSVHFAQFILQDILFPPAPSQPTFLHSMKLNDACVMELGAGIGFLATVLSPHTKQYYATDIAALVPLMRKNISKTSSESSSIPKVVALDIDWVQLHTASPSWRSHAFLSLNADIIICCDCIYNAALIPPLITTLNHYATPKTSVVIVAELRDEDVLLPLLRNPFASDPVPQLPVPATPRLERPRPIARPELFERERRDGWSELSYSQPQSQKRRRGGEPTVGVEKNVGVPFVHRSMPTALIVPPRLSPQHEPEAASDEDENGGDFPPTKRRRTGGGITDMLLTSALNVALVGTAVGLTAYRFWNSGKPEDSAVSDQPPPPPYEPPNWVSTVHAVDRPTSPTGSAVPSRPTFASRKKPRSMPGKPITPSRRRIARSSSPVKFAVPAPPHQAIEDELGMQAGELEEQMDWMSAQLQNLIAEGQKALGKEIVVGTDTGKDDDLVDDGDDGWEEEQPVNIQRSRSGSTRGHSNNFRNSSRRPANGSPPRRGGAFSYSSSEAAKSQPELPLYTAKATVGFPYSHTASTSTTSLSSFNVVSEGPKPLPTRTTRPVSLQNFGTYIPQQYPGSPELLDAMDRVRRAYGINQ